MTEWRCRKMDAVRNTPYTPNRNDFKIIIDKNNIFQPWLTHSMKWNSEKLSEHLKDILCLSNLGNNNDILYENSNELENMERLINNEEILELITEQDLPLFFSIDSSVKNNSTTVSISIIIPEINNNDVDKEWWYRPAKVLLIRMWKLPSH
jgi:hypothetical protein